MSYPGAAGSGTTGAGGWAFNPPPGWPAPPPGWQPPAGWQPDPSWPPAPLGWSFWVPAAPFPSASAPSGGDAGAGATAVRLSLGGQSVAVRPGQEARIGRAPGNDIVVDDPTVSRQHAVVRSGASGWRYVTAGSAHTFQHGRMVSAVTVDRPSDLALGSPDGPVLHLEPVSVASLADPQYGDATARAAPTPYGVATASAASTPYSASIPHASTGHAGDPEPATRQDLGSPATRLDLGSPDAAAGWRPPPPGAPGSPGDPGQHPAPGWVPPMAAAAGSDDLASALRILFPVRSWVHNSGWRQGLRLGVIAYALLPLIFLTVLSSSSDLSTPGWAYSLYVAPLWLIGFWLLIRPPQPVTRQVIVIAVAIVAWTLIWINIVTITINDALPTKHGIGFLPAVVISVNEEVTKALPVFLAGLLLLRLRGVKLDVRTWMFLGTIAGLTFGVAEQAFYTPNDIVLIKLAGSASEAVTATLAFAERVFVDGFQHAVWAGISGFFMGLAVNYRRRRVQLVAIGIGAPALLHALNDWLAASSPWLVIIIQAASLLLFLGYTMTAASIEQKVRETPIFRGQSIFMEAIRLPGQRPASAAARQEAGSPPAAARVTGGRPGSHRASG